MCSKADDPAYLSMQEPEVTAPLNRDGEDDGPELVVVVGGWFACGVGWCVRGDTIEEAVAEYHAAIRRHAEIAARPEDEWCPDRCGGRAGHSGPHQSGDWDQSLDHAWAEAEAALPEPGHVSLTGPFGRERVNFHAAAYSDRTERVENATADIAPYGARLTVNGGAAEFSVWLGAGNGPTPTAALQALAAKLRETP